MSVLEAGTLSVENPDGIQLVWFRYRRAVMSANLLLDTMQESHLAMQFSAVNHNFQCFSWRFVR